MGPDHDGWIGVTEDRVSQAFSIKIGRRGGRFCVVGLRIDNGREVTANTLRSIRLGRVLEECLGESDVLTGDDPDEFEWVQTEKAIAEVFTADAREVIRNYGTPRTRRGNPPSDEDLQEFAEAYKAHLTLHPRSAMHHVTRKGGPMPMARSTGYRWLRLARERGYIGPEEGAALSDEISEKGK